MKVVDASVLVAHLVGGEQGREAKRAIRQERSIWAPVLVDAEVGNALRRQVRMKEISPPTAQAALAQLRTLPLQRVLHQNLVKRAWELRDNVSFYDGLYVALAEELDSPLLTLDRKLASASGLRVDVELVAPV
jgi:predicted nucleic acid-binding protein